MEPFTKENFNNLKKSCEKIIRLCDENIDGNLMAAQLIFLGENIKELIENSIVKSSGILPKPENVSNSIVLQVGMRVKVVDDKRNFPHYAGTVKTITKITSSPSYPRSFILDNDSGGIWIIKDFEYCVDYPDKVML